jgi:drug/metabolite transporter (DMT)-like permease
VIGILVSIAILTRISTNPLANIFQKKLASRGQQPLLINFLTYLGLGVVAFFWVNSIVWQKISLDFWVAALVGGFFGALGNSFLIKALQHGELSVLGPINSYKSLIAVIFGIFLLGETPNHWGIIGIVLIIFGSYWVLDTMPERFSFQLFKRPEIQFRIWAMILTAIEAVWIKKLILLASVEVAWVSWCWFGALFSFILLKFNRIHIKTEIRKINRFELKSYLFLIICIGLMQFTTTYVFRYIPVGYALALFQSSIILSIFFGQKVFGERDIPKKLIGSLIMIVGSLLLILLKNQ